MIIGLLSKKAGKGNPHMVYPIERYIRTNKKKREERSLFKSRGVSLSAKTSESVTSEESFIDALYPAFPTAVIISVSLAVPSTPIELVSRLTEQAVTPLTPITAFSTRALQAAQLIPFTLNCFTKTEAPFLYLIKRYCNFKIYILL